MPLAQAPSSSLFSWFPPRATSRPRDTQDTNPAPADQLLTSSHAQQGPAETILHEGRSYSTVSMPLDAQNAHSYRRLVVWAFFKGLWGFCSVGFVCVSLPVFFFFHPLWVRWVFGLFVFSPPGKPRKTTEHTGQETQPRQFVETAAEPQNAPPPTATQRNSKTSQRSTGDTCHPLTNRPDKFPI